MRVLVYDDQQPAAAEQMAGVLQQHLLDADVLVMTEPRISLLELPAVDVIVVALDSLRPRANVDVFGLLTAQHPQAVVIVVFDEPDEELVQRAVRSGVRGFVGRDVPATELATLVALAAAEKDPAERNESSSEQSQR